MPSTKMETAELIGRILASEKKNLQEAKEKAAELATKAGENLRLGSEAVGKMIADAKLELDRKNLRPVFEEELLCGNEKERAICIVERDKKRSENEVCRGQWAIVQRSKGWNSSTCMRIVQGR